MTPASTGSADLSRILSRQFPQEWPAVPFWSIYRRVKRPSTGTEELLSVYRDHGVVRKMDREDNFNQASEDLSLYQLVHSGDLVINKMKAWQGSAAVSSLDGIVSPAYFVFERVLSSDSLFMHYLLRSSPFIAAYRAASKGIRPNQWDLDPNVLRTFPLRLPPLDLQRKIGGFLDRETKEIDAFIRDQEELIGLLQERRDTMISDAVTNGIDATAHQIAQWDQLVDGVPSHWTVQPLRHGVELVTSGSRGWADYYSDDGDVFLRIGNLSRQSPHLRLTDIQHVRLPRQTEGVRTRTRVGDVLFSITAYLGSVGLVTGSAAGAFVSQHVALVRPRPAVFDPAYLAFACLGHAVQNQLTGSAYGGTKIQLSLDDIRALQVPRPPLSEQRAIAKFLAARLEALDLVIDDARQAMALSRERRLALVSAAVTGKVYLSGHEGAQQ